MHENKGSYLIIYFLIWSSSLVIYSEVLGLLDAFNKKNFALFWFITFLSLISLIFLKYSEFKEKFSKMQSNKIIIVLLALFFFIIFYSGLIYPPNNYDSLTYHLPRFLYWIQSENLDFFATNNLRQLFSGPFNSILFSFFFITNSDYLFFRLMDKFAFNYDNY